MKGKLRLMLIATLCLLVVSSMASAKTTITFWSHTHPPMVDLNYELIKEFEAANPDIKVEYTVIPNNHFFTKVLTAMSTGTGPDVMNMSSSQIPAYIESEVVLPVMPEAFGFANQAEMEDAWLTGAFDGVEHNGVIYGVPSEFNITSLIMNKRHMEEAGLDPAKPPKTWDEVLEYGEKLTVRKGGQVQRRGFDFFYVPNFYWVDYGMLLGQLGGSYLNAEQTEAVVNNEIGVNALKFWYDLVYDKKIAGPELSMMDSTNIMTDYIQETVSMSLAFPWSIGLLEDTPVWEDSIIVPLPQMDPDNPVSLAWAYYWMVNKDTKEAEAAWKFVNFLASHPERWLIDVSFVQPRKGWSDSPKAQEFPFLNVWLDEMENAWFGDRTSKWSEISSSVRMAIERSIMNGVEPQTSLDQAKQEIDAILK
ncbi:MAG: ABC transporter substrate-binding protein [Firmicutes bacterium]|nr:ABC transporter substrate-binding protein [Bacillota bacterium]